MPGSVTAMDSVSDGTRLTTRLGRAVNLMVTPRSSVTTSGLRIGRDGEADLRCEPVDQPAQRGRDVRVRGAETRVRNGVRKGAGGRVERGIAGTAQQPGGVHVEGQRLRPARIEAREHPGRGLA